MALGEIGRALGEGLSHNPVYSDPDEQLFALCYRMGWRPDRIRRMPYDEYRLFNAYAAGRARGENAR